MNRYNFILFYVDRMLRPEIGFVDGLMPHGTGYAMGGPVLVNIEIKIYVIERTQKSLMEVEPKMQSP